MSDVPQVDLNTELPILDHPEVDIVMVKARREWRVGIGVLVVFMVALGGVGWGYTKLNNNKALIINNQTKSPAEIPKESQKPIAAIKPVVAVWNGSGVTGAAGKLAEKLMTAGYNVVETKNAPKEQVGTSIMYQSELLKDSRVAKLLGELYPEAKMVVDESLSIDVRIILGK